MWGIGKSYFDPEIIEVKEDEVFVDAGGYDGDTLADFLEYTNSCYKKYYFFEPEISVFEKAYEKYSSDERIVFLKKGISNKTGIEYFDTELADVPEMLKSETGNVAVEVTALDDLELVPTFIKMDIEGAECDALDGAEKMICQYLPKLAICVYHRPNDILDIFHRVQAYGYQKYFLRAERNTLEYDVVLYAL